MGRRVRDRYQEDRGLRGRQSAPLCLLPNVGVGGKPQKPGEVMFFLLISVLTTLVLQIMVGRGLLGLSSRSLALVPMKEICKSVGMLGIMKPGREVRDTKEPLILASYSTAHL